MSDLRHSFIASAMLEGADALVAMSKRAEVIARAADLLTASLASGGKVLLFGNGGSAADAQHLAAELVVRLTVDRAPIAAIALTVDSSALTAIANDYGYEHVFERQLHALCRTNDVVVAITTSGKSPSVIRGVEAARKIGAKTIGLTGARGASFAASCDVGIVVPTEDTARIQQCHITIGHVLCTLAESVICNMPLSARARTSKRVTLDELADERDKLRACGATVVWTNGCFDILHAGHVDSLRRARDLGDALIVGVNDDAYVRSTKGENRPIHPLDQRIAILSALEMVDYVLPFGDPTPAKILERLRPDVHCKGAEYAPPNGAPIPEAEIVRAYGGRIEFLPLVAGLSTTSIVKRLASE